MKIPFSKKQVYDECLRLIEEKVDIAKQAMDAAQASANNESKSSAGDKYETGRAMAQLERDKSAVQLSECLKLRSTLASIDPSKRHDSSKLGSLVVTDQGIYFLAIGIGQIKLGDTIVIVLSTSSPLGNKLLDMKADEKITFNGKDFQVIEII
jgi:transcription elongation GreA/GreB family factor